MRQHNMNFWNRQLHIFFNLLLVEGKEILSRIKQEEMRLSMIQKEADAIPLCGLRTSPVSLLRWIFRKAFFKSKIEKLADELNEIRRLEGVVSAHLEYCEALHANFLKLSQEDICESIREMLEEWYIFSFPNYYRNKFVNFPSEVRIHEAKILIEQCST